MSLQNILFGRLSETDIQRLIDSGVGESVHLDYKQQMYGSAEKDKKEFRKDISAMANTLGGDLVIGVVETEGIPTSFMPLGGNCDKELQRLEELAGSCIEPRIPNLLMKAVPLDSGGNIIVVRVPRSFMAPHRVTKDSNSFFARAGTTTYEPNVEQLRLMFTSASSASVKIRAFHADRLVKITAGETPIPMNDAGKLVIHVVPLPAFTDGSMTDLVARLSFGNFIPLPPNEVGTLPSQLVNLDGYLNYASLATHAASRSAYAQFFRNGVIEGVADLRTDDGVSSRFVGLPFVQLVVGCVSQFLATIDHYDMGLPAYVFVSLCKASETIYRFDCPGGGYQESGPLGREIIALPEIYIDSFDVNVAKALRPAFNVLWNAFGHYHCDVYDTDGNVRSA